VAAKLGRWENNMDDKHPIRQAVLDVLLDEDFEIVELNGRQACEIADLIADKIAALSEHK
jgi:hypothetical protein